MAAIACLRLHCRISCILSHSLPLSDTEMQKHWTPPDKECDRKKAPERLAASFKRGKVGMVTQKKPAAWGGHAL